MDLALGPDDDLLVEDGRLALVRGADALVQRLRLRLELARGAWFLDLAQGVPYVEQILVKGVEPEAVAGILRAEALKEPEVRDAQVTVTIDGATRAATARVVAFSVDGVRVETSITIIAAAAA